MLNVSNIQHFSVGDGSGIRTTVFLKGCHLRCPWCHNPENLSKEPTTLYYKATDKSETLGRLVSVEQILSELLEDRDFYEASGGGVTLSGGEAMLQAEALLPLVKELQGRGISVLIDTAGSLPYSSFQILNPFISGYLFDFKTADAQKYKSIGGDLTLVSENLSRLLADGIPITVRIPLIPHFNCEEEQIEAIARHLHPMGITRVELLPFHRLGSAKYEAMGLDYAYRNQAPLTKNELTKIENAYQKYFTVKTEG